ncbi:hypothetical protein MLD38_024616 [Melastoma candidum]|uniref:Uncharacterized protein n=1 Tax=Melastoma candidum TaxID=119954 RepID=A0ACB9NST6_9MYRT|nr:hypothetical protein MLD38_024616 [Melastoma candidum]
MVNGCVDVMGNGFVGERSSHVLRTYKRRKIVKVKRACVRAGLGAAQAASGISEDQECKELLEEYADVHASEKQPPEIVSSRATANGFCCGSPSRCTKYILENLRCSWGDDCGVGRCVQIALANCASWVDEMGIQEFKFADEMKCFDSLKARQNHNPPAKKGSEQKSNHYLSEANHRMITEKCQNAFCNILVSDKFVQLSKLLSENFSGTKFDRLLDFHLVDSRMKDGFYDRSPTIFYGDISQVWKRLQGIGLELVSLANGLSDISSKYCEHVCSLDSPSSAKLEQSEDCDVYRVRTCQRCGERADVRECLVCDSCEEMYHVSCTQPAVEEIPPKSWYCTNCIENGVSSPHDDCTVCERLIASRTAANGVVEERLETDSEDSKMSLSDDPSNAKGMQILGPCKICGEQIENGDRFRSCEHNVCRNSFHLRCLTAKQLKCYSRSWYCPSCLCRACLADRDDDKIVLCDGCDNAYHIYCMKPPRSMIPKGKWFCRKCAAGIRAIRKARKAYEKSVKRKKAEEGAVGEDNGSKRSAGGNDRPGSEGGMDMLLNAADTLNDEEKSTVH